MHRVQIAGAGGRTDDLRRSNLSSILRLVHANGQPTRTFITRETGLNRSTVGVCLGELIDRQLVHEMTPPPGRAGRPSPLVMPDERIVAVTVNPEVDAITVGLVGLSARVIERVRVETGGPLAVDEVVRRSALLIRELLQGRDLMVCAIGVAVPGQVRLSDGVVRDAFHLGWEEEPLAAALAEATGIPVLAANAAVLGMRGESSFGAGRDVEDLVYLIGGASGIGGGAITGGQWVTGAAGYAGEFGHTFVRTDGLPCYCGARGCLEAEITQQELLAAVDLEPSQAHDLAGVLTTSRDPAVRALVEDKLGYLAIALRNLTNIFNPSVLVLGGFLDALYCARSEGWNVRQHPIRAAREGSTIVSAALGADQLTIGTAELAFSALMDDPLGWELSRVA